MCFGCNFHLAAAITQTFGAHVAHNLLQTQRVRVFSIYWIHAFMQSTNSRPLQLYCRLTVLRAYQVISDVTGLRTSPHCHFNSSVVWVDGVCARVPFSLARARLQQIEWSALAGCWPHGGSRAAPLSAPQTCTARRRRSGSGASADLNHATFLQ